SLTPSYTVWALKFNANAILLSSWPRTAYFFLQSLRKPGVAFGVLTGIAGGIALLGKYYSLVLFATLLGVALLHPARDRYFRSLAPYVSIGTGMCVVAPHVWWLLQSDFPTIRYGLSKTRYPVAEAAQHTMRAIGDSYLCQGLAVGALALAFGGKAWSLLR